MQIGLIKKFLEENKVPPYRLGQVMKAVYADSVDSFSDITTISKDLRQKMSAEVPLLSFEAEEILASDTGESFKAGLRLAGGDYIETVLLKQKDSWSVCISSQVGCAMGCRFCATGALGFKRNLTSEEITDQVLFWKQYMKKNNFENNLKSIVFMGMGEPMNNYKEVKRAIEILTDENTFNFGMRHISVSTSGLPSGIKQLAKDFPQINLAISLIVADNAKRSELMRVNERFDLGEIKKALDAYFKTTNRKVFLEYIMFKDYNDSEADADNLADFVKSNLRPDLLHVNLISYNTTSANFLPSDKAAVEKFKEYLGKKRISATIRKSLGEEIKAACGQLAARKND